MNIWMDIAIPALVFAAGYLALAVWALLSRVTYIARADSELNAELSKRYTQETRTSVAWEKRAHEVEEERNDLRRQIEQYSTDALAQARRIDACLRERDEAIHQCNALQLQLNEALKK